MLSLSLLYLTCACFCVYLTSQFKQISLLTNVSEGWVVIGAVSGQSFKSLWSNFCLRRQKQHCVMFDESNPTD